MYIDLHENYLLFLSDFNQTGIFNVVFQKILIYQILCKSVVWGPRCSTQTDRQRDMMNLIVGFPNFMKAPESRACCCCCCRCYCHNRYCCEEILFKFVTYNLKVYRTAMFVVVEL